MGKRQDDGEYPSSWDKGSLARPISIEQWLVIRHGGGLKGSRIGSDTIT